MNRSVILVVSGVQVVVFIVTYLARPQDVSTLFSSTPGLILVSFALMANHGVFDPSEIDSAAVHQIPDHTLFSLPLLLCPIIGPALVTIVQALGPLIKGS